MIKNYFFFISLCLIFLSTNTFSQGDNCATAVVLPGSGTYNADGPSTGGGCFNCTNSTNADWYLFTAPSNGIIDIATCMGGTDTRFWVYNGTCGILNQIAAADDECDMGTGSLFASEVLSVPVTSGTTYYIEFDDRWSTNGFTWNFTFSAPCGVPAPLPYSQNFDGVAPALPNCWTTNNATEVTTTAGCAGSTNESLQVNGVAGAYAYSPVIDASGQSAIEVSYLYRAGDNTGCTNAPEAGDNLNVDYWNGSSWVNLANYDGATAPSIFTPEMFLITSGLTNSFQLRFESQFGSGSNFDNYNFDDLLIQSSTTCIAPTNLTASNITGTAVDLGWTEIGSATTWDIEWGATGFNQTQGTMVTGTTTNPHNLTGLVPATSYDFYVRADCGAPNGLSVWSGPYTFTTACVTMVAPYYEYFDTPVTPNCWNQSYTAGGPWQFGKFNNTDAAYGAAAFDDFTNNGGYYAYVDFSGNDVGVILEMPNVDVGSLTTPELSFYLASHNIDSTDLNVLNVEAWNGTSWVLIAALQQDSASWLRHAFNISSNIYGANLTKIRFRAERSPTGSTFFYNDLLIDNVSIDNPSAIGIQSYTDNQLINIFPNPTTGMFTLETKSSNDLNVQITNLQGQLIYSKNILGTSTSSYELIDLSKRTKGVYLIHVISDEDKVIRKIVVQ